MTTYRATRNEPRVGIGNWTGDFRRNELYESGMPDGQGKYPPGTVPDYICDYLVSHGLLIDSRVTLQPADSPVPVSPMPTTPKVTRIAEEPPPNIRGGYGTTNVPQPPSK